MILAPVRVVLEYLLVAPISRLLVGGPDRRPQEITTAELSLLVAASDDPEITSPHENDMLQEVVRLSTTKLSSFMVPRVDMVAFDINGPRARLQQLLRTHGRSRIPIYEGDVDHIIGVLHARDYYLHPRKDLRRLLGAVRYVPEQMTADRLLVHFRDSGSQIAVVVDEYGGVAGLVTMKDVVEQIVGELHKPTDDVPPVQQRGPYSLRMAGDLNVQPWYGAFGITHPDLRITTLGGLVTAWLGRLPKEGEELQVGHAQLTVEEMKGNRVQWVGVRLSEGADT
jgi:CBS domain containing-hemolysin-like protein